MWNLPWNYYVPPVEREDHLQQCIGKGYVSSQDINYPRELIHLLHCIRIHEPPTFGFLPKTVGDNLTSLTFFGGNLLVCLVIFWRVWPLPW